MRGEARGEARGKAEGQIEEAKRILIRRGTKALGALDAATKAAIDALVDRDRLETLIDRVDDAETWQDLLGKPRSQRRNGKKRR